MPKYLPGFYVETVEPPEELQILTTAFPVATVGVFYEVFLLHQGGVEPVSWSLVAPNNVLPSGLNRDGNRIYGTPSASGNSPLTIRATDNLGSQVTQGPIVLQVTVENVLTVTTTSLPAANRGVPYDQPLVAINNTGAVTWDLVAPNNVLPTGLSLVGNRIQGTPTVFESVNIVARATDSVTTANSGLIALNVNQVAALVITSPTTLPQGQVNVEYDYTLQTSGGWEPITWTKLSGNYPVGVTLDDNNFDGTPDNIETAAFVMEAEDSEGRTATKSFSLNIVAEGTLEGAHDYWNELILDPSHFQSYSLRNQAQINGLSPATVNTQCQYLYDIPGADTAPDPQDAMKITFPVGPNASGLNGTNVVYFGKGNCSGCDGTRWNITPADADSVLLIWDQYWDSTFRDNCGNITHIKSVGIQANNGTWMTIMQSPGPGKNATDPASVGIMAIVMTGPGAQAFDPPRVQTGDWSPEWYADLDNHLDGWEWAAGMWEVDNVAPTGPGARQNRSYVYPFGVTYQNCAHMKENMWMRYIFEIRTFRPPEEFTQWNEYIAPYQVGETPHVLQPNNRHPSGTWHMVSAWIYREDGTSDCVMNKIPLPYGNFAEPVFSSMRWTMESSKHGNDGPQHGYARNFVMLKNYALPESNPESDNFIFRHPVR